MTTTPEPQDYGIKISKPFFDAQNSGDADLIFSSAWPSLPVAFEETLTVDSTMISPAELPIPHGLGFPPLVLAWKYIDNYAVKFVFGYSDVLECDDTNIYLSLASPQYPPSNQASKVHIKAYNIDLSVEKEYAINKPPASQLLYDPDFGIKVVKEGMDYKSTDLRDFILHSRAQSPLIMAVKTQESATGDTVRYVDPQGYLSWVFGFVRGTDGRYKAAPYFSQGYPQTGIDVSALEYSVAWETAASDDGATLVVLRDPMFTATDEEASY